MQLLASVGHEFETVEGLGWIPGEVVRIAPADPALKVPHMGWNDLVATGAHPVLDGVATGDHAYFVHGWQVRVADPAHRLAFVDYGGEVTAIVGRDTIVATQFHPEKSQATGLRIIRNFLAWRP
jgi:glutamine amidotransferase